VFGAVLGGGADLGQRLVGETQVLQIIEKGAWRRIRRGFKQDDLRRAAMPRDMSARDQMERKLLTQRGRKLYRLRGQTVEPVFGQMKETQGADGFMMCEEQETKGEYITRYGRMKSTAAACLITGMQYNSWARLLARLRRRQSRGLGGGAPFVHG
jgi:hypothetical protein